MPNGNCRYYKITIPKSGDEKAVGFRCLAGVNTFRGCPRDCRKYEDK